jgi:3-oxoacyl-[acyl-carrier-protein] synthase-3
LARQALGRLLESCPEAKEAEFIIYAGISNPMPTVCSAALLSSEFGLQKVSCWDIKSGCSSGVFALQQAIDWFGGKASSGIIVCSETFSKFLKMEALQMSLATGDGACAMYVKADASVKPLVMIHGTDAQYFNSVYVPGKYPVDIANYKPEDYQFCFADKGTYLEASLEAWSSSLQGLFTASGRTSAQVTGYYSHQVDSAKNAAIAEAAGIAKSATLNTFKKYGNIGCPGVFINYMEAARTPKRGDLTVFQAVGGGLTWASILVEQQ